jgi:hypothetical protein
LFESFERFFAEQQPNFADVPAKSFRADGLRISRARDRFELNDLLEHGVDSLCLDIAEKFLERFLSAEPALVETVKRHS